MMLFSDRNVAPVPADWSAGPERKVSLAKSESADSGVGAEPGEEEAEAERRVIRPDDTAVRRLLNFDEVRQITSEQLSRWW